MRHVGSDEMSSSESAAKTELARKDTSGHNTSESTGIVSRIGRVRASNTEKVEASALGFKDCATTDGADLDAGHGDGNLEVAVQALMD